MRSLKIKVTNSSYGYGFPQHSSALIGWSKDKRNITYEITDIPVSVNFSEVIKLFNLTIMASFNKFSYKFAQLGIGKIVK